MRRTGHVDERHTSCWRALCLNSRIAVLAMSALEKLDPERCREIKEHVEEYAADLLRRYPRRPL